MGSGGGGSMQSTTVTSNIPDYAKPYVENMLGAAEQQIFTTGADGTYNGYRPYQPYSVNPQNYFAAPTQLQQQAYSESLGMQTPGQFATGTGLASLAGTGQLGLTNTARQYGAMGAGYGNEAAGYGAQGAGYGAQAASMAGYGANAGNNYNAIATTPSLFQPYMSPYVSQVIQPQLAKAQADYEIASTQANLASARQGAYGGARQALQQSEREKGLAINKSNIIGQGLQNAYDSAMQSVQFGSGLGLQGLSTAYQGLGLGQQGAGLGMQGAGLGMQGASVGLQGVGTAQQGLAGASATGANLANIGTAQQQSDLNRLQQQNAMGSQYQDYQQGIINQAVQDYATAQQYPYMQLGMMSSLVRGLPMQNMTTQQYQAQPSVLQQGAGLLGAYGSYKGAFKEGGAVKRYDVGGSIAHKIKKVADGDPSGKGLASLMAQTKSPEIKRMIAEEIQTKQPVRMADGGVPPTRPRANLKEQLAALTEAYQSSGVPVPGQMGEHQSRLMDKLAAQEAGAGQRYEDDSRLRKALAFLEFGSNRLGPLQGAISGGKSFLAGEAEARQGRRAEEMQRAGMMAQLDQSRIAGAQQHIGQAQAQVNAVNKMMDRMDMKDREIASREGIADRQIAGRLQAAGITAQGRADRLDFDQMRHADQQELARLRLDQQQGKLDADGEYRLKVLEAKAQGAAGRGAGASSGRLSDLVQIESNLAKAMKEQHDLQKQYRSAAELSPSDPALADIASRLSKNDAAINRWEQMRDSHPMTSGNQGAGLEAAQQNLQPQGGAPGRGLTGALPEEYKLALEAVNQAMSAGASQKDLAPLYKRAQELYTKYYGAAKTGANPPRLPKDIEKDGAPASMGEPNPEQDIKDPYTGPYKNLLRKAGLPEEEAWGLAARWGQFPPETQAEYKAAMGLSDDELANLLSYYTKRSNAIPQ